MEHPSITRVNRYGDVSNTVQVCVCSCCGENLYQGTDVIEWEDDSFCDQNCLVEFFLDNMDDFGVKENTL